jgi:hypothetical protein
MISDGKWIVREYSDGAISVGPRHDFGFVPVCSVVSLDSDKRDNARLIAASKELLAACKLTCKECQDECGGSLPYPSCERCKTGIAILKAKGKS